MLSIHLAYDPTITLLSDSQEKWKAVSTKDLCKSFTSALLIIAKYWKQPRSSSTWGLVNKSRGLYTVEQYSAAARNEWIQHNWILNTVCWTQEARHESPYCMISFIWNLRICDDRNQKVVPEGSGQELTGRGESLGWWKGPVFCFWWRLHWYLKLSKLTELNICVSYCMQILLKFYNTRRKNIYRHSLQSPIHSINYLL